MMNTIKLVFDNTDEQKSDLIIALLDNENVQGFDYNNYNLQAYYSEENFDENSIKEILEPFNFSYTKEIIPPANWNETWEKNFEPIIVNDTVAVKAHFHEPISGVQYVIEITPKMSFGTGHHATTQLMLQYMCEMDFTQKRVFDFGCGTGVLAIFSAMKNASHIIGIDNDEWSVENAKENCERNNCTHINFSKDDVETINEKFDVILANIQLNILIQYREKLKAMLAADGMLLLSGLLVSDIQQLIDEYIKSGFRLISQKQQKEWVALAFQIAD